MVGFQLLFTRTRRGLSVTVAVVAALLGTSCAEVQSDPTAPQPSQAAVLSRAASPAEIQAAIGVQNRHTDRLMAIPGVVGTGVGLRSDGRPIIKVFTATPGIGGLPSALENFDVAVEVTGMFFNRVTRTEKARAAPIGFSIGHPDVTAGTLGARVKNGSSVFILSNNHVIANSNNANLGDPTLQPGAYDGGSVPEDVIGGLAAFQRIHFDGSNNEMDAAISLVDPADVSGSTPPGESYGAPGTTATAATLGMPVQKYGRTTGHTVGEVAEINVTVTICYAGFAIFCTSSARFVNQISITPGSFSSGGDSGSLIVTNGSGNNPVGLLFAGSSTRTIANPIGPVLTRFGVEIDPTVPDGGSDPAPDPEEGTLSGTVTDVGTADPIAGATVSVAGTTLSATTLVDGSYTIAKVPAGPRDVTASATGYLPLTRSATIVDGGTTILNFALQQEDTGGEDPGPEPGTTVRVASITYGGTGGPQNNRHLLVTIRIENDLGTAVSGAAVSTTLSHQQGGSWNFSGTTGSDGTVTFRLNNAASGCYESEVTNVTASGLDWDGETPANGSPGC